MRWRERIVPLKFKIGDFSLFSIRLRLHECSLSLAVSDDMRLIERPHEEPPLGQAEGYMLRSAPAPIPLPVISSSHEFIRYVTLQYSHCHIDLTIGIDAYMAKFSPKTRSTLLRKIRRFKEHNGGELRFRVFRQPEEMLEFHNLARAVSSKTYQERLLNAGIPVSESFIDGMQVRASENRIRGYILFQGSHPVSYLHCPINEGVVIYAHLGYDPEYMSHSVGTVLQYLALEDLFAEGRFKIFDFTEGQSEHKRLFSTHETSRANLMFLRRNLRNLLLVHAHESMNRLSARIGALAQRMGLKSVLKRALRHGWTAVR